MVVNTHSAVSCAEGPQPFSVIALDGGTARYIVAVLGTGAPG